MEEAATSKAAATEDTAAVFGVTGGGETANKKEKATAAMTNWENMVALVSEAFREGLMTEEATW